MYILRGKKSLFVCHTLTHGTDLRRTPLRLQGKDILYLCCASSIIGLISPIEISRPRTKSPKGLKFPKGLGKCVPEKGVHRTLLLWGSALVPRGSSITNAQFQRHRTTTSDPTRGPLLFFRGRTLSTQGTSRGLHSP